MPWIQPCASSPELVATYKDQGSVERGFRAPLGSLVPGFLGVRQKAGAHRRSRIDHGPLLARLSSG